MVCQLVCVGVSVVVGGRGGEHLAVLVSGHWLGTPEVGLDRCGEERRGAHCSQGGRGGGQTRARRGATKASESERKVVGGK